MSTTQAQAAPVATTVDARGQSCPGPLVTLFQAMKGSQPGELFELLATDPGSRSDVPSWAAISGNELVESGSDEHGFRYLVRKA
ncbi:MAG TPA: sulfurtransferase TusA family protein [Actinomycetota bacterium]|nr:sulfurtransferase TusA family protein [Actinomycetota bacterium]